MKMETCNECGRSVKMGSGFFVNRIYDLNDIEARIEMEKPYPDGDFICILCDEKFSKNNFNKNELRDKRISD
ncbi:MAG: hypothetical protein H8D45_29390 [Bacteroidetes bacterium]|nr:hypothetical protein [Bacteroidota bacterium]